MLKGNKGKGVGGYCWTRQEFLLWSAEEHVADSKCGNSCGILKAWRGCWKGGEWRKKLIRKIAGGGKGIGRGTSHDLGGSKQRQRSYRGMWLVCGKSGSKSTFESSVIRSI